jgi:hypothetical protein
MLLQLEVQNILDEDYAKRADKWFKNNRYFPGEGRRFMLSIAKAILSYCVTPIGHDTPVPPSPQ